MTLLVALAVVGIVGTAICMFVFGVLAYLITKRAAETQNDSLAKGK